MFRVVRLICLAMAVALGGSYSALGQNGQVLKGGVTYDRYDDHKLRVRQMADAVSDLPSEFQGAAKAKVEQARAKLDAYIDADEAYRKKLIEADSPRERSNEERYEERREIDKLSKAATQAYQDFDKAFAEAHQAHREAKYWADQKERAGPRRPGTSNPRDPARPGTQSGAEQAPRVEGAPQIQIPRGGEPGEPASGRPRTPQIDTSADGGANRMPDGGPAGSTGGSGGGSLPGSGSLPGPGAGHGSMPSLPSMPTPQEAAEAEQIGLPPTIYKDIRQADIHLQYILGFQRGFNQRVERDLVPSVVRMTLDALIRAGRFDGTQTQAQQYTQSLTQAVQMMGQLGQVAAEWLIKDLMRDPALGGNPLLLGQQRGSEYFDQWHQQVDREIAQAILGGAIAVDGDGQPQPPSGPAANQDEHKPNLPAPVPSQDERQLPAPRPPSAGTSGPRGPPASAAAASTGRPFATTGHYETTRMAGFLRSFDEQRGVRYYNDKERAIFEITVRDGRLYDASGRLFDTTDASTVGPVGSGRAIFVMDAQGGIFASKFQAVGQVHHSSLSAGEPIAAAGEIEVRKGVLISVNRDSGHYTPEPVHTRQFLRELQNRGMNTSDIRVEKLQPR